jgi:Flp pilus assembly protein TadB
MGKLPGKEEKMENAGVLIPIIGVFIPIVAIVSTFTMIIFAIWFGTRQKEREAFYKAESLRRITESSSEGAKAAIELLKEEEHLKRIKSREGMKIGGLVNLGVGVGLTIFLWVLAGHKVALVGLIPALIGVALLIYVFFMAGPVE